MRVQALLFGYANYADERVHVHCWRYDVLLRKASTHRGLLVPEHPTRRAPCSSDELFQRGATEVATPAVRRRPRRKERLPNYSYAHRRYYLTSCASPAPRLTRIQEARGPRLGWRGFPRAAAMCNTLTQALAHHGRRRTASATATTSAVR